MHLDGDNRQALRRALQGRFMTFTQKLADNARRVDACLAEVLSPPRADGIPDRLLSAMRHAALGQGKRFRPCLVIETAALFGVALEKALDCAVAFELVHSYSLVHDDLPAMDDDDLRRGQPAVHRAFDEWTAILAGDALQALAFDVLARPSTHDDPAVRLELVRILARAAGPAGMVGGQCLDLEAEKRGAQQSPGRIIRLQAMKTGALIAGACDAGAVLGSAPEPERATLERFGREIGLAFQIADDLLDVTGKAALMGKATTKDAKKGKATLVSFEGPDAARETIAAAVARAIAALVPFGDRAEVLIDAARYMAWRER